MATALQSNALPRRTSSDAPPDDSEFTLRAILVGLLIGVLLCFVNMHFGLQSGWISMMSLQSALLGFAVFRVLPQMGIFVRPLTIHENVLIQTTAVATGTLPLAAGLVGLVPAFAMLTKEEGGPLVLSPSALIGWCCATAFFGVFLAVPLRRSIIVREKLTFPSGTATAQIITVLHAKEGTTGARKRGDDRGYSAVQAEDAGDLDDEVEGGLAKDEKIDRSKWKALSTSFSISAIFAIISIAFPVLNAIPIFDLLTSYPLAHDYLFWFNPSLSYVAQGIIMGPSVTAAMNLGMLLAWGILSPLSKRMGWAPGDVSDGANGAKGWILWPALAILLAEALVSLGSVALSSVLARRKAKKVEKEIEEEEHLVSRREEELELEIEENEDEPSNTLVIAGFGFSCISCVVLVGYIFGNEGIRWWATIIALFLASIFSILGVRALGETDLNPVSAIGKISQLLFAFILPNNLIANLVAGGISEAGANQAGDLMQDLKTGHLLGASPRSQFCGQLIGSAASIFASSGIYILYSRVYTFPSNDFPVPSAAIWLNLARLLNKGTLPPKSKEFMILFGAISFLLAGSKAMATLRRTENSTPSWTRWIPSGVALAIGFINTPSFSIARGIGGLISLYFAARQPVDPRSTATPSHLKNITLIIVASGFILGEGGAAILALVYKSMGGEALSCFGCGLGGGGYCAGCD